MSRIYDGTELKKMAIEHFKAGGSPAIFASENRIPRTTVIGWRKRWDEDRRATVMGRPRRLEPFNETQILKMLFSKNTFQNWESVRDCIMEQSGERVGRRSVFRCLKNWGLTPESKLPDKGLVLLADQWVQPARTIVKNASGLRGTIWRLVSGRGMEGFVFTANEFAVDLEAVAKAVVNRLKGEKRELRTNHGGLVAVLKKRRPSWGIEVVET